MFITHLEPRPFSEQQALPISSRSGGVTVSAFKRTSSDILTHRDVDFNLSADRCLLPAQ